MKLFSLAREIYIAKEIFILIESEKMKRLHDEFRKIRYKLNNLLFEGQRFT